MIHAETFLMVSSLLAPKRDLKLEALLPYLEGTKDNRARSRKPQRPRNRGQSGQRVQAQVCAEPHSGHSQPVLDYVASLKVPVIVCPLMKDLGFVSGYDFSRTV